MARHRLITDSFPRRRRRPGRPPGKAKVKGRVKIVPQDPTTPDGAPAPTPPPQNILDMLRRFDLSWEYGPCTGITRLQRWERAQALGLKPPLPVLDALLEYPDDPIVTYSLWHEYGF